MFGFHITFLHIYFLVIVKKPFGSNVTKNFINRPSKLIIGDLVTNEINLKPFEETIVARRYEITAILEDIHGQHAKRVQDISEIAFDETTTTSEVEKETEKQETIKRKAERKRPADVATFPKDDEGYLLVPFGGKWGYMMGALKTAVADLYKDKMKQRNWEGFGLLTNIEHGLHVIPQWIKVGKSISNPKEKPKIHMVPGGWGRGAIFTYFDYVEKTEIKFSIEQMNLKIPEKILMEMLAYCQRLGFGPKGRGILTIQKVVKTKG